MVELKKGEYCYVAVISENGYSNGVAVKGEKGYHPLSWEFKTWADAENNAKLLNAKLGLTEKEAALIAISTMSFLRGQKKMDKIVLENLLKGSREKLVANDKKIEGLVTNYLSGLINGAKLEFKLGRFELLNADDYCGRKCGGWQYEYGEIELIDENNKRVFGCEITITISEKGLFINHGTCGEYSSAEKYFVIKAHLIAALFDHEQEIIKLVAENTDLNERKTARELEREIWKAQYEEEKRENERLTEEATKRLKAAKYLKRHEYNYDEYFAIVKVTDKTVKVKGLRVYKEYANSVETLRRWEEVEYENHNFKIDDLLYSIKSAIKNEEKGEPKLESYYYYLLNELELENALKGQN